MGQTDDNPDRSISMSAIFDCEGVGMALMRGDGTTVRSNRTFLQMLDYPENRLQGMNAEDWTLDADWAVERKLLAELASGSRAYYRIEKRCLKRSGGTVWVKATVSLLPQTERSGVWVLVIAEDITDRKRLERQAREERERLEKLALLDGLTHIANRRYFDEYLVQQFRSAQRDRSPIALIMLDIDYFKEYNDAYGHPQGDACLVRIAGALRQAVKRPQDMAFRYGGEEFAVILPNTDPHGAKKVAKRLHGAIATLAIPHRSSAAGPFVSASLGAASVVPGRRMPPEELIGMADDALYEAKRNGRNHVAMYGNAAPRKSVWRTRN